MRSLAWPTKFLPKSGNQFRMTDGAWNFNLNIKVLGNTGNGTWLFEATLFDGSKHTVWVSIKK